jgi:hypothetical protein
VIFDNPEFVYDRSSSVQRWWQKYIGFPIPLLGLKMGPDNWVKRVIGATGDTVEGRIEGGKTVVYRNGKALEEVYRNPFPLLVQHKDTGFVYGDSPIAAVTPSFLRAYRKQVRYAYDPTKSLEAQSFYHTSPEEIVKDENGEPRLLMPRDPSYNEFGKNVDSFGPFTVPDGKLWVQGDSRRNSRDSRFWGFLDQSLVQGRASAVVFSLDSEENLFIFSFIKHPIAFFTRFLRWGRTFMGLHAIPSWKQTDNK